MQVRFHPYNAPAGGLGSVRSLAKNFARNGNPVSAGLTLMNQTSRAVSPAPVVHGPSPPRRMLANLLLLRGNISKPGAGICPVRGHSNVQGQRTVGITEKPELAPLDRLADQYGFSTRSRDEYGRGLRGDAT